MNVDGKSAGYRYSAMNGNFIVDGFTCNMYSARNWSFKIDGKFAVDRNSTPDGSIGNSGYRARNWVFKSGGVGLDRGPCIDL